MDRQNEDTNYLDHSYAEAINSAFGTNNSLATLTNPRNIRTNQRLQGLPKNEGNIMDARHSLDFHRNVPAPGVVSLKEKLRKNANVKKWKGRREKQFGNNNGREQSLNSPDVYAQVNNRYAIKNSNFPRQKTDDKNLNVKKEYFNNNLPRNKSLKGEQYLNSIKKVYHTIDYDIGRNKSNQLKRKKFGSNSNSQNSSNSNSLTRSNKFIVPNDFIFNTSQYQRGGNNLEGAFNIKEALNNNRKPNNNGILAGLSNMKRRK